MYKHRGSIAIEMVLVLMGLSVCLGFAADLSRKTSLQGELDNLSYAAVNLLSESKLLFPERCEEDEYAMHINDAIDINKVIYNELEKQLDNFDDSQYAVRIDAVTLRERSRDINKPVLDRHMVAKFGNDDLVTQRRPLAEMIRVAPYTSKKRFAPMYRVTIYYRSHGIFNSVIGKDKQGAVMVSSSFSVGR